jgi:hypothetical protein
MKNYLTRLAALALVAACLSGCNGVPQGNAGGAGVTRSGGVEVFGTIDAAVTHTTTRSGR